MRKLNGKLNARLNEKLNGRLADCQTRRTGLSESGEIGETFRSKAFAQFFEQFDQRSIDVARKFLHAKNCLLRRLIQAVWS